MTPSENALWQKMQAFQLDEKGSQEPFSQRLSKAQNWSPLFTQLAMEEYKRFIFLAAISPTPVTPSIFIDEVWHFHLVYTRQYWETLCGDILEKVIHHDPGQNGPEDKAYFQERYRYTLQLYEQTFNQPPPPAIWFPRRKAKDPAPFSLVISLAAFMIAMTLFNRGAKHEVVIGILLMCVPIVLFIKWVAGNAKNTGGTNVDDYVNSCASSCGTFDSHGSDCWSDGCGDSSDSGDAGCSSGCGSSCGSSCGGGD
ncbi:hypothetical protein LX64_03362 [Chitinophaga skermanii]|uniref:Uncharacterized protein n=1 Tax=Chitinophaga skermanii TaxID=331697 RepID=A0A327QCZ1_9BACT|nr:hypothetical protein [Chitinophaga skermanii]RAJ02350.1 hypothetical protein LX64_03362 [Chitinophaga skermanii]